MNKKGAKMDTKRAIRKIEGILSGDILSHYTGEIMRLTFMIHELERSRRKAKEDLDEIDLERRSLFADKEIDFYKLYNCGKKLSNKKYCLSVKIIRLNKSIRKYKKKKNRRSRIYNFLWKKTYPTNKFPRTM